MKIASISICPYRMPFRNAFATAHSALTFRFGAIVEIATDAALTGVGEIAPLPEFGGGTLEDALASLPAIVARLHAQSPEDAFHILHEKAETLPAPALYG